MKMTRIATALAVSAIAASAFAGSAPKLMGDNNTSHQGFYVGALAGYGQTKLSGQGLSSSGEKLWSFAGGLNGGYQFNNYIAAEVGGLYFGETTLGSDSSTGTQVDVKAKDNYALYAAAKGMFPINNQFDLFGKLGIAAVHTKYDAAADGLSVSLGSQTNASLLVGLGGEYYFTQNLSMSLEADYFSQNNHGKATPRHIVGLLGLAYHF